MASVFALLGPVTARAEDEDHPLISRYPGSSLTRSETQDFAEYNRPFWHGAEEWEDEVEDDPHEVECGDLRPWEDLDRITHPVHLILADRRHQPH